MATYNPSRSMASALSGDALIEHAKAKAVADAQRQMRYGPDLARQVKTWPRMQATSAMAQAEGAAAEMIVEGSRKVEAWPSFVREAFGRLYTGDRAKETEVKPEHSWARALHSALDELPEWQRLAKRCQGDSYSTKSATLGLGQKLYETVPEHKNNADELRRMKDLLEEDWGEAMDLAAENGSPPPPKPPELQEAEDKLQQARDEAEHCANNMDHSAVRQAARGAIQSVNEHLDEVDDALRACGWGNADVGAGARSAESVKQAVAQRLMNAHKLREILDLAGRMKNIMREAQAAKVRHGGSEITDIEAGADIARLLPSEAAMMRHPKGKLILFRKFLERSAMQYNLEGKKPSGRGPIVVCIDDSGSMAGNREVWAKAVSLAMLELARRQGRAFAYCTFSQRLTHTLEERRGEKSSPATILDAMLVHEGGGTDFDPPLTWAIDRVAESERLQDADIVFISDGDCRARSVHEHKSRLRETGARVWGIAVGASALGSTGPGTMQDFCTHVYSVRDIGTEPNEASDAAARAIFSV